MADSNKPDLSEAIVDYINVTIVDVAGRPSPASPTFTSTSLVHFFRRISEIYFVRFASLATTSILSSDLPIRHWHLLEKPMDMQCPPGALPQIDGFCQSSFAVRLKRLEGQGQFFA